MRQTYETRMTRRGHARALRRAGRVKLGHEGCVTSPAGGGSADLSARLPLRTPAPRPRGNSEVVLRLAAGLRGVHTALLRHSAS